MCTADQQPSGAAPSSVAEALRAAHAGLDYLNSPAAADLAPAGLGDVLVSLGQLRAKTTAAHAGLLRRFEAAGAHDGDGYPSSWSWLTAMTKISPGAATATVRQMRSLARHPRLHAAMARGGLSESWFAEITGQTRKLPDELRDDTDKILLEAAAAGADLDDLKVIAAAAWQQWLARHPGLDDGDDFDDRQVRVGTTLGGAACLWGNLTPECSAAVTAVLEALGKRQGREDHRTAGQRWHDALQLGCEMLIRAKLVPGRAGADTHVAVHIPLADLLQMDGGSLIEAAWLAGGTGYLTGDDARAAACDALVIPVVTGHADMTVIDQMIELTLAAAHGAAANDSTQPPRPLPPQAWAALRYAIARLAIGFVSGPDGLAAALRTGLLKAPYNTASLPLDIGFSDSIPAHIRRAVLLRDRHCAWPGCDKPPAHCDVHHLRHKADGGKTSVTECVLLCQFHHDVCVHRWGWRLVLHPDGTTTARGPHGQILHSHSPPTTRAG